MSEITRNQAIQIVEDIRTAISAGSVTNTMEAQVLEYCVSVLGRRIVEASLSGRIENLPDITAFLAGISPSATLKALLEGITDAVEVINANIGNGYVYAGIATPSGTPVSGKVFYLAKQAGQYANFGGLTVTEGVNILKRNGSTWTQEQLMSMADIYKNPLIGYYECDTAGDTSAKTVTAAGYVLPATGGSVKIKMANRNTVANATLNINSTGAKPLYYNGQRAGVGNTWDTNEIIEVFYDGAKYQAYNVAGSNGDGVFDISAYNLTNGQPTPYEDLEAALGPDGNHVPLSLHKGGVSIKFIQGSAYSSDNKYVQYRLMKNTWSATESDWQGVDDEPAAGSENLVKSGGSFAVFYNKDTEYLLKELFNEEISTDDITEREGYALAGTGVGTTDPNTNICIITPSSSKLYLIETTYNTSFGTRPTVQLRETVNLTNQNVLNVSYKRGANSIIVYVDVDSVRPVLAFVHNAVDSYTVKELTPKYEPQLKQLNNNLNSNVQELKEGVIQETLNFEHSYSFSSNGILPIPKGAIITEVSGVSSVVRGYKEKDSQSSDYLNITAGLVVPTQINYFRSLNYNGEITIKYKIVSLSTASKSISNFYEAFNKSLNLANPKEFINGFYVLYLNGNLTQNANYCATGYIPVTAGQSYYLSYKHQIAWYNDIMSYISGSNSDDLNKIQVAPEGAAYLRCSVRNDETLNTFIVAQSNQVVPFVPYGDTLKESAIAPNSISSDKLKPQVQTNKAYFNAIGNIASGDMVETSDFPLFVKKGLSICFYAKITSFNTLYLGKGYNKYRGQWLKIDNTNITIERYESSIITVVSIAHGLTLSTFIKVNIVQNNNGTTDIVLQTIGGDFKYTSTDVSYEWNYELFVRSSNTTLTDAILNATIQDIDKPVWLFGDSYFGVNSERVIGQLKNLGLFNYLVDGLAGANSSNAYADLQRLLVFSKPKYIVWCLGMNDTNENFTTYFNSVKSYCETYGITMIGCTIPTVPTRDKETISTLVRNSGLRYIDAYKAVGADAEGNWYSDYLSSDGVHPTAKGAKAIALQWTIDFPELYIYCRYKDDVILQNSVGVDN